MRKSKNERIFLFAFCVFLLFFPRFDFDFCLQEKCNKKSNKNKKNRGRTEKKGERQMWTSVSFWFFFFRRFSFRLWGKWKIKDIRTSTKQRLWLEKREKDGFLFINVFVFATLWIWMFSRVCMCVSVSEKSRVLFYGLHCWQKYECVWTYRRENKIRQYFVTGKGSCWILYESTQQTKWCSFQFLVFY